MKSATRQQLYTLNPRTIPHLNHHHIPNPQNLTRNKPPKYTALSLSRYISQSQAHAMVSCARSDDRMLSSLSLRYLLRVTIRELVWASVYG